MFRLVYCYNGNEDSKFESKSRAACVVTAKRNFDMRQNEVDELIKLGSTQVGMVVIRIDEIQG